MKWRIVTIVVAVLLAGRFGWGIYQSSWSPQARAREAGGAFLRAAADGHEAGVRERLAADADLSPAEVVAMYQGFINPNIASVMKALPNQSGVEYILQGGISDPAKGMTQTTNLAMKREDGRWVVVRVGSSITY